MVEDNGELERELAALARWAEFPAGRSPRPVVLTGRDRVQVPSSGFPDDERKQAYLVGAVVAECEVPLAVLSSLRGEPQPHPGDPLVVSSATQQEAVFETDRGPQFLPAWSLVIDDVAGAFVVLDPMVAGRAWSASEPYDGVEGYDFAVGEPGGLTFTLHFIGSPQVYADYHPPLRVHTSAGAVVAGRPVEVDLAAGGLRRVYAQRRDITIHLSQPLGDRVLVDSFGQPVPVLTELG